MKNITKLVYYLDLLASMICSDYNYCLDKQVAKKYKADLKEIDKLLDLISNHKIIEKK